ADGDVGTFARIGDRYGCTDARVTAGDQGLLALQAAVPNIAGLAMIGLGVQGLGQARLFLFLLGKFVGMISAAWILGCRGEAVIPVCLLSAVVWVGLSHGSGLSQMSDSRLATLPLAVPRHIGL